MNLERKPAQQLLHHPEGPTDPMASGSANPGGEWTVGAYRAAEESAPGAAPALSQKSAFFSLLGELAETVLLAFVIFLLIRTALQTYRVDGSSMEPNFFDGQFLVVDKVTPRILPIQRGDVVIFHYPGSTERDYIKRVVALPGEQVEVREGRVYINGNLLEEPYETYPAGYSWGPGVVGDGQLFVLGDNRSHSSDSHSWGTLDQRQVVGRAWLTYWPPENWGVVPRYSAAETGPR